MSKYYDTVTVGKGHIRCVTACRDNVWIDFHFRGKEFTGCDLRIESGKIGVNVFYDNIWPDDDLVHLTGTDGQEDNQVPHDDALKAAFRTVGFERPSARFGVQA